MTTPVEIQEVSNFCLMISMWSRWTLTDYLNLKELDQSNPEIMQYEVAACANLINNITKQTPRYFRAPWGLYSPNVTKFVHVHGMEILNRNVPMLDTFRKPAQAVIKGIQEYIDNIKFESGDIILFHENAFTLKSLDRILSRLDDEGFIYVIPN